MDIFFPSTVDNAPTIFKQLLVPSDAEKSGVEKPLVEKTGTGNLMLKNLILKNLTLNSEESWRVGKFPPLF